MQYSIAVCRRPEVAGDIISGRCVWLNIPHKSIQFCDHLLNRSEEPSGTTFSVVFSNFDKYRLEAADDVVFGAALVHVGVDVSAKFSVGELFNSLAGRILFTLFRAVFSYIIQPTGSS